MEGKEIIIRIVNEEASSETEAEKITEPKKKNTSKIEQAAFTTLVQGVAKNLKGIIVDEVKYQLVKNFELTDNYIGLQNMNIALNIGGKAFSYAAAIAVSGPAGAAFAISDMIRTSQSMSHNYYEQKIRIAKMDAQLQFNRERAGYSLTAGSRGENR